MNAIAPEHLITFTGMPEVGRAGPVVVAKLG
jgi:hypothetical protein